MCGIAILSNIHPHSDLVHDISSALQRRGPDSINSSLINTVSTSSTETFSSGFTMIASVLHIQGETMCRQPYTDEAGNILLWNGEVFNTDFSSTSSDTLYVSSALRKCTAVTSSFPTSDTINEVAKSITDELSHIEGPYAFIYFSSKLDYVFLGRDPFGRRSLLRIVDKHSPNSIIGYTSVSIQDDSGLYEWEEVNVDGIYYFPAISNILSSDSIMLEKWPAHRIKLGCYSSNLTIPRLGRAQASALFLSHLTSAISVRVNRCSNHRGRIGVLFSGGIDSVLLAAVLCKLSTVSTAIELINVTFYSDDNDNSASPDRLAAIAAYIELKTLFPHHKLLLIHVDISSEERRRHEKLILQMIKPCSTLMDLNIGSAFWFASRGVGYIQDYSSDDLLALYSSQNSSGRPLLRVGEDGAAKGVGRVDRESNLAANSKEECSTDGCGRYAKDRCVIQACGRCCKRRSDVDGMKCAVHKYKKKDELEPEGEDEEAIHIINTTSSSLSMNADRREVYCSESLALLVGIGADEHLAGYGRHRTVYSKQGIDMLHRELVKDQERLWQRNLGRDDRCISDHGREAWFPYLDERLIGYLHTLNINDIADFSLGEGEGDKLILRDASRLMGLTTCTGLVKRAIQFGTKIAKLTNVEYHGSNRKGSGQDLI